MKWIKANYDVLTLVIIGVWFVAALKIGFLEMVAL